MSPAILDSRKLLAFATLARVGSFTLAAKEMGLTQSAVSHAIKALERDLECRLFDRMGRMVTITPAGRQLLSHTDIILAEMQTARADMAAFNG
jgi:DNA-binding transcriptional LysR family regulator